MQDFEQEPRWRRQPQQAWMKLSHEDQTTQVAVILSQRRLGFPSPGAAACGSPSVVIDNALGAPGNLETCFGDAPREIKLLEVEEIVLAQQANLSQGCGPDELCRTGHIVHMRFAGPADHNGGLGRGEEK